MRDPCSRRCTTDQLSHCVLCISQTGHDSPKLQASFQFKELPDLFMRIFLFALLSIFACSAFAQDSLFYTNGNVIVGQIEEIGLNVIKYRTSSDGRAVLIEVDKKELSGVKLNGGQAYSFTSSSTEPGHSTAFLDRKHVVSLDVISPALNHLSIGYEHVLAPRINLMVKAGYIGLWNRDQLNSDVYNSKGGVITAGVKFILPKSTKRIAAPRDVHPLAGWYLRPDIMFSAWKKTSDFFGNEPDSAGYYLPEEVTYRYSSAALLLSIGRQLFLGEHITFDISGGLGYGAQWRDGSPSNLDGIFNNRQEYAFSHAFLSSPLVVTGALRFGYAF